MWLSGLEKVGLHLCTNQWSPFSNNFVKLFVCNGETKNWKVHCSRKDNREIPKITPAELLNTCEHIDLFDIPSVVTEILGGFAGYTD